MVFGEDNPATLPGLGEPVFVLGVGGKVIVVDVEYGTGLTEAVATRCFPRDRSRKKMGLSGRFDREFAPDGFFDFEPPPSIVLC